MAMEEEKNDKRSRAAADIANAPVDEPKQEVDEIELAKSEDDFSVAEEHKLIRKLDFWIIPLMMVTYTLQSYDKGIISAATQFGFNADLGLTTVIGHTANGTPITDNQKYSNASFMFYIGYLCGTYPMMYLSQHYPTSKVIGIATFIWGIIVMSTAGCTSYAGIVVNRFFLGVSESVVAPAFTVLVTFWWTRQEQVLRNGLWYGCVGVATAISPLINYGLGSIHGHLLSWKYMFLILGIVTTCWSFVLYFCLPDSPFTTKGLNEQERKIAIARLERNNAGTLNRIFDKQQFFEAFRDFKLYSCFFIVLLTGVPSGAIGTFGTVVINGFGFNHFDSLALTCPIGAITAISIFLAAYVTRKVKNLRLIIIVVCALISIAGTVICWFGPRNNRGVLFAGIFLIAVQVASGGLAVSMVSSNIAGHTKKSTVSAATFVGYCVGNTIGPEIFGASPGPVYHAGFLGSFICLCGVVVIAIVTYFVLWRENRRRDRETGAPTGLHSIDEDLTDMQNEDFRYVL